MAPPGIRVLVHVKPDERTTWSPHGEDGWYTGPALESYRCYTVWIWASRATRVCDTLTWLPTKLAMPIASSNNQILSGIHAILHVLRHPSPAFPLAPLTTTHHHALLRLTDLLTSVIDPPRTTSLTPSSAAPLAPTAADSATPDASLRVAVSPIPDEEDASLRVAVSPIPNEDEDTSLRVVAPSLTPPRRTVQFAPLPSDTLVATFMNSTGLQGKQRRKTQRKRPPQRPVSAAKTIHPTKRNVVAPPANSPIPPVSPPHTNPPRRHSHGTRLASRLRHVSASARHVILAAARAAQTTPSHFALHGNAFDPDTGKLAKYRELSQCSEGPLWQQSNADEIGRLAQGHGAQKGTNTMYFIKAGDILKGRKATYLRVVAALRPEKENPRRVRWTVGGDRIDYPDNVSTKTADLTTAKLLINSTISTPSARYMTADLKDFCLGTPMARYEYMQIPIDMLPDTIIDEYNLRQLFHKHVAGNVCCPRCHRQTSHP